VQDDHRQEQGGHDQDHCDAGPPLASREPLAARTDLRVLAGVWVMGLASHAGVLLGHGRLSLPDDARQFNRHYVNINTERSNTDPVSTDVYTDHVPRLWTDTIEAHRQAVRDATLTTTAALVAEHGLASVTMSQIAEQAGIGRATLYKYFPDVESILAAWHERHVGRHLDYLAQVRDQTDGPGERLRAVLEAYALITHERPHGSELAALLHRGEHITGAEQRLRDLVQDLLTDAAQAGDIRDDVPPAELVGYCLNALGAAGSLPSKAAVRRLVTVTLAGLCARADSS
jgi:AcrR family transcriptional regulator